MNALTMDEHLRVERVPPSCAPCRKKKAKCDRGEPCTQCLKSKLNCSYERVSRTPLTRKYLTEVEEELARTKDLLRHYEHGNSTQAGSSSISAINSSASSRESFIPNQSSPDMPHTGRLANSENVSPAFTLETPPMGELDWDERPSNVNANRLNDGMASLTDRNGYMGIASGSALLRMAGDGYGEELVNGQGHASAQISPPILPALYSLAQLEPFIDSYFATYHISYPIVHEPTFRAQFMDIIPRPNGRSWHVLMYIIAAIGCFAAESNGPPQADIGLFDAAKSRMSVDMIETGNITLVQAMTLISNYVQKRNRPNSGYNYMGLAKRMAWGLALHKEFPAWRDQPFRLELRRRVWWSLYIFDVGAIITFSRPLDMPADGIEVGLPLNIGDSAITSSTRRAPEESAYTTLYTHVRCQSLFHLATNSIYQRLISVIPSAEEMLELDATHLQKWLQSLPIYFAENSVQPVKFRLCHAILQWRWRNFRLLMFRPYLMRRFMKHQQSNISASSAANTSSAEDAAIRICLATANESIRMISKYWMEEHQNVLTCWYALYFLFQAVLLPVISLRNDSYSELAPSWRDDILLALDTISDLNRLNPAAARCHSVITKLCGAYLAMDISLWESPTNESPQTQMNTLFSFLCGPITDSQLFDVQNLQLQESSFMDFMGELGAP